MDWHEKIINKIKYLRSLFRPFDEKQTSTKFPSESNFCEIRAERRRRKKEIKKKRKKKKKLEEEEERRIPIFERNRFCRKLKNSHKALHVSPSSSMDFQVVVLAGGTSKNLVPLVSKVLLPNHLFIFNNSPSFISIFSGTDQSALWNLLFFLCFHRYD